jgi:methyl-galactoside transport system permease protein
MNGALKKLTSMGKDQWKELFIQNAIIIVIFCIIVGIIIKDPNFVSLDVLRNILTQSSVRLILAFGVGGLIIIQGTDLSLGRIVGFAAIISASLLQAPDYTARFYPNLPQLPLIVPLLASCLVCALASGISGWVCAKYKIHPFLATLGMMVSIYGVLSIYFASGAPGPQPIGGHAEYYKNFVIGTTLGIPNLVIYAAIVTVVVWFLWNKTTFGKNLYAIGGNPEAAKVSGVNVAKTTILAFLLAGVLYGIGGFLEAARIGSANNGTGYGYEMDAIAACVVGGVSFLGGIGKVSGVVVGVLLFTIINYGMTFIGLDQYYQYIIKGIIIVAAVALDAQKYIKKS